MIDLKRIVLGPIETNVYIITNTETRESILVDPAERGRLLYENIENNGNKCVAVFLTHGHFDHITGLKSFNELAHVPVYAAREESDVLKDARLNCSDESFGTGEPMSIDVDHLLEDGEEIDVAGMHWKMLLTPGHTKGSCCYYLESEKMLLSGDTIFEGSVGRTDLPTGSMRELLTSINSKIKSLPDDVEIYPGHGGFTTIKDEKQYNMYFSWHGTNLPPDDL